MKTDIDQHYETLKLADAVVLIAQDELDGGKPNPTCGMTCFKLAKALLDIEERRQLALGYLSEAQMNDMGPGAYVLVSQTEAILNLSREV